MKKMFVILGKTSTGKDTIMKELLNDRAFMNQLDIKKFPSCTTRPPRVGEKEGVEYFFKTMSQFDKDYKANKVAEYATYKTKDGIWVYYSLKEHIDKVQGSLIGIKNPLGLMQLSQTYKKNIVSIEITCPKSVAKMRYEKRGAVLDSFEDRFLRDNEDFKYLIPNYFISNSGSRPLDDVVEEVKSIIYKELTKGE